MSTGCWGEMCEKETFWRPGFNTDWHVQWHNVFKWWKRNWFSTGFHVKLAPISSGTILMDPEQDLNMHVLSRHMTSLKWIYGSLLKSLFPPCSADCNRRILQHVCQDLRERGRAAREGPAALLPRQQTHALPGAWGDGAVGGISEALPALQLLGAWLQRAATLWGAALSNARSLQVRFSLYTPTCLPSESGEDLVDGCVDTDLK